MPDQEIFVVGEEEIVLVLGLLGIQGAVLETIDGFIKIFNDLIKNTSIGMIIIAIELPSELIDFLIDFKLNNRRPFIYYLPDIFKSETENIFLKKISESISKIIR